MTSIRKRASLQKTRGLPQQQTGKAGLAFELAVKRIQELLAPQSVVTHNELIVDRVGNTRQCDVVVRGSFAGMPTLCILECKDHYRRKGPEAVEAFAKKTENLRANLRAMVSRHGFTDSALRLAEHENIGCFSLLAPDRQTVGFTIGSYVRAIERRWGMLGMNVRLDAPRRPPPFDVNDVMVDGKRLIYWCMNRIQAAKVDPPLGWYRADFDLLRPISVEIHGTSYGLKGFTCHARRETRALRQWVSWTGDALIAWRSSAGVPEVRVPANGSVQTSGIDLSDAAWEPDPSAPDEQPCEGPRMPVDLVLDLEQQLPHLDAPDMDPVLATWTGIEGPFPELL